MQFRILVSLLLFAPVVLCSRVDLFPFGPGAGDATIEPNAKLGSHNLTSGKFLFFGYSYTQFYVHSDGVIGIENVPSSEGPYTFPLLGSNLIAPFWAGADTTTYSNPAVFYRETTDSTLIQKVEGLIVSSYNVKFAPSALFIATWDSIGYQAQHTDKLNTFQVILAFNTQESYVLFLYNDIQWVTADRSGGIEGLGGTSATVGLNLGDGIHYLLVPGSGTSEVVDLDHSSNNGLGIEGLYIFKTHATVAPGPMYCYSYGDTDKYEEGVHSAMLQVPVTFYGKQYSTLKVSIDGYINLGSASENIPTIAPFWLKQATSGVGAFYFEETTDSVLRAKAQMEINLAYDGSFVPTSLFIATWISDGLTHTTEPVPMFQAVIASKESQSYVLFLYKNLPDSNVNPIIGLDSGDGVNFISPPGSGTSSVLNVASDTNIGIEGEFVFGAGNVQLYTHGERLDVYERGNGSLTFSSENFPFPSPFVLGGNDYTQLKVYVDGFIRLGAPGESVCTESFPTSSGPIIASFWTDADTRNGVGYLSARVTTDVSILSRARTDISLSSGRLLFDPVWALVATWNVSPAQSDADKNNIYQVVLVSNGVHSHVLYIYERLQWSSGGNCGPAITGCNKGDGIYFAPLPGSGTNAVLSYTNTSNVGLLGFFIQSYISTTPRSKASVFWEDQATPSTAKQPHNSAYKALEDKETAVNEKSMMYKILLQTYSEDPESFLAKVLTQRNNRPTGGPHM